MDNNGNSNSSATTVLVAVVIIVIIALAFYFGFYHRGGTAMPNSVDVNLNTGAAPTGGTGTGY